MSRAQTRARKRRRRMENDLREVVRQASQAESDLRDAVDQASQAERDLRDAVHQARRADAKVVRLDRVTPQPRPGHGVLWRLLRDIERAGLCVWDVARAVRCNEEELAMIAQAVAPELAGMTPGIVLSRREQGK